MLYLDGISLSFLRKDLEEKLSKKKINRIFQNTETSLSLYFGKQVLVLSCNPQLPICYVTNEKEAVLEESISSFLSNLRKYLMNSVLYKIEQISWDRVLYFHFTRLTELGDYKSYFVIFEMMGRNSNIFLCDENKKMIDLLKRSSIDEVQKRNLFPGALYEPFSSRKILPTEVSDETSKPYYQSVEGVGKLLSENITTPQDLKKKIEGPPTILFARKEGKILLLNFLGLVPKTYDELVSFDDIQEAITQYFQEEKIFSTLLSLRKQIEAPLRKRQKKIEEILKKILEDEKKNQDFKRWKELGDVLSSCLFQIKKGDPSCQAFDFYHNENIAIALETRKTPQENLEQYYKKYNKAKTTLVYAKKRREQLQEELSYLKSLFSFLEAAEDTDVLKSIEEECVQAGYLKEKKKKGNKKKKKLEKKYGMVEYANFILFYGRNNIENDFITFQLADRNDYWFHVKDIPASHVILKAFAPVTNIMIETACHLAAKHSQVAFGDKVCVDYTLKKFIKKPKNAKPGFVHYTQEKAFWLIKENKGQ